MNDFTVTSIETISGFDITTGKWLFTLDELQSASISQAQEKTDITGKQGRKINSLKKNKSVTVEGTNGLVSTGLMGVQTGSEFEDKTTEVMWTDYLTVKSNAATTAYKAVGTSGNEIESVYVRNANGGVTKLEQAASAASGKFAYAPATKALTFSGLADGTEIVVFYKRKVAASVHENMSDNYSGKCELFIDFIAEDKCANIYRGQFHFAKADVDGEFSFEMGDNQTVQAFSAESLAGSCGNGGALWEFIIYGASAEDVA